MSAKSASQEALTRVVLSSAVRSDSGHSLRRLVFCGVSGMRCSFVR